MSDEPEDEAEAEPDGTTEPDTDAVPDGETDTDGGEIEEEYGADAEATPQLPENGEDETTPHVDLQLYQLSVSVSGQSTDGLADVSATAQELMDYLIDRANQLEEEPDTRGLG